MATITTYSELLTQIGTYLARSDYTAQAPVWVTLAHNKICRRAKNTLTETKTTSFSINAEYVNVPTGFLEAREFYITSTSPDTVLQQMQPDMMTHLYTTTGQPVGFAVVGTQFRFAPAPDATYTATLVYYSTPSALVVTSQETNALFPTHADVYLYGALVEAATQHADDIALAKWKSLFEQALQELNNAGRQSRFSGNLAAMRPA